MKMKKLEGYLDKRKVEYYTTYQDSLAEAVKNGEISERTYFKFHNLYNDLIKTIITKDNVSKKEATKLTQQILGINDFNKISNKILPSLFLIRLKFINTLNPSNIYLQ